jgi:4-phytase/acid phosphatase
LHRDRKSGAHTVQVFFIAQTLEQIRSLSQLDGERKPQVVPIFVPGCSGPAPAFACRLEDFDRVVNLSIDKQYTRFLMH